MTLKQRIKQDLALAMKRQDKPAVSTLRMLLSEVTYGEMACKPVAADHCCLRYRKRVEEQLTFSSSQELLAELGLVRQYCPEQPTRQELEAWTRSIDRSLPFGQLMKEVKRKFPFVDFSLAAEVIKAALN
jgi:uncharacterized protein YqeY